MRRVNRAASGLVVLLTVGVLMWTLVLRQTSSARVARQNAAGVRPGVRLAEFMGSNISPAEWLGAEVAAEPGIPECSADYENLKANFGFLYDPMEDLKFSDPESYSARFGYGVIEAIHWRGTVHKGAVDTAVVPGRTLDASSACVDKLISALREMFAPVEVSQAAGQLLQASAGSLVYRRAVESWRECLLASGFEASDPLEMSVVVGAEVSRVAGASDSNGEVGSSLTADQITAVQDFELRLHGADQTCRSSTGLDAVMYDLETEILASLHQLFPLYGGVNFHHHA